MTPDNAIGLPATTEGADTGAVEALARKWSGRASDSAIYSRDEREAYRSAAAELRALSGSVPASEGEGQ